MQISPLTIYAIQALQEIRRHGAMPCEEIARSLNISRSYAKKTTHVLCRAGLIRSVKRSGYVVVGRPSLLRVLEATEGILPNQEGETQDMSRIMRRVRGLVQGALNVPVSKL